MVATQSSFFTSNIFLRNWNWILSGFIFFFGCITFDRQSIPWGVSAVVIYAIPLGCQLFRNPVLRFGGLWFGIFLWVQVMMTPWVHFHIEYRTLEANIDYKVERDGEIHHVTTDEMGFRVAPRVDYARKKGLRVFSLGGSTTEEIHTGDEKTWTHLLQEKLSAKLKQQVEVINTGVSGARTRNHYSKLKKILEYQPDLVIFLIGINDWNRHILDEVNIYPFESYYLRKSLLIKGMIGFKVFIWGPIKAKLFKSENFVSAEPESENKIMKPEEIGLFSKKAASLDRPFKFSWKPGSVSEEYEKFLKKIASECQEAHIPCLFLTQPHGYQEGASETYKKMFWMTPPFERYTLDFESMIHIADLYNNHLLTFAKNHRIESCDLASQFKPSSEYFLDDCHFAPKGTQKVAELVFQCSSKFLLKAGNGS